jgi:hypothetical protein
MKKLEDPNEIAATGWIWENVNDNEQKQGRGCGPPSVSAQAASACPGAIEHDNPPDLAVRFLPSFRRLSEDGNFRVGDRCNAGCD